MKQAIAEAKRIRKYYFGNFYTLAKVTVDPKDWCVTQYHRPGEKDGIILAFRRHEAGQSSMVCKPYEIEPDLRYEVNYYWDYELAKTIQISGAELEMLELTVEKMPGSVLIEYRVL